MKLRDVMSVEPLVVGPDAPPAALRSLMETGRVRHLPLVDGEHLVGMWLASDAGPVVLLGPERVAEVSPDVDALDALALLLEGREAVVATDAGAPVGILTRADALRILQDGLAAGTQRPAPPLVIRLIGPAGAGKSSLLIRSIARLRSCEAGIIEANPRPPHERLASRVEGAHVTYAPHAHWRKGLREAIARLGGAEVIFVEDRDQPARAGTGLGEDVQVLIVPLAGADAIDETSAREVQAVVLTRPDEAPGFDPTALAGRVRGWNPEVGVFLVGPADDDPGLGEWLAWLEERIRRHRA